MQGLVKWLVCIGLLGIAKFAHADYDLVVKMNCLACHTVDKRKYGPNFKEIASKYAKDKNAVEKLAKKIRAGGSRVWGEDVMPPQPQVSEADARAIAKYVMSL